VDTQMTRFQGVRLKLTGIYLTSEDVKPIGWSVRQQEKMMMKCMKCYVTTLEDDMKVRINNWDIVDDNEKIIVTVDYFNGAYDINIKDSGFTGEQWLEIAGHIESIIKQVDSYKS
jgi:hypothetical protein